MRRKHLPTTDPSHSPSLLPVTPIACPASLPQLPSSSHTQPRALHRAFVVSGFGSRCCLPKYRSSLGFVFTLLFLLWLTFDFDFAMWLFRLLFLSNTPFLVALTSQPAFNVPISNERYRASIPFQRNAFIPNHTIHNRYHDPLFSSSASCFNFILQFT